MLKLSTLDFDELVMALQSQDDYHHFWLIDPVTGEVTFTSTDLEPDLDLDGTDLIRIEPLPSRVWYADMADFAERIPDKRAGSRLARALEGRGAFRRFKNELYDEYPHLLSLRHEFSGRRGIRRAVEWLVESSLIDAEEADRFLADYPDVDLTTAA